MRENDSKDGLFFQEMHKLRKSKQTQHIDWADTVFRCDVEASHVMPYKEDMWVPP